MQSASHFQAGYGMNYLRSHNWHTLVDQLIAMTIQIICVGTVLLSNDAGVLAAGDNCPKIRLCAITVLVWYGNSRSGLLQPRQLIFRYLLPVASNCRNGGPGLHHRALTCVRAGFAMWVENIRMERRTLGIHRITVSWN